MQEIIIDGSFVTDKDSPEDIDLVIVLAPGHDYSRELRPFQYNVLFKQFIRRRYGFDILVGLADSDEYREYLAFFGRVRGRPDLRKGLLRIRL